MTDRPVAPAPALRLEPVWRLVWPWAAFLAILAWGWRVTDLFHNVPGYGDALEVLWGLEWYAKSLAQWHNPLVYPAVFAPAGWQVATLAHGPAFFLALMPLYALGGAAFAFNLTALGANALAFAGMYKMARLWLPAFAGVVVALAYTFWGYRWFRNAGHLHTIVMTALMPFQIWTWEQARRRPASRARWFVASGLIWGASITASLYALWLGALLLLAWGLAGRMARQTTWQTLARGLLTAGLAALLVSGPTLWLFWRGMSTSLTQFFGLGTLVGWAASANSLPIPSVFHPWLSGVARTLDHGPLNEAEMANFGTVGALAALLGAWLSRANKRRWPLLACSVVGLVFALGPALKWDGRVSMVSWLRPVDNVLWTIGLHLKPALFSPAQPPDALATAFPLPDMLAAALVPFWEGARVTSRFAFVAALGVFPLVGCAMAWLKPAWLRAGLALVVLFEVLPRPTASVPAQPAAHPAFAWLQAQDLAGGTIIDLAALQPDHLTVLFGGDVLFSTLYHRQATVSGVGSYLPAHYLTIHDWFDSAPHPLSSRELVPLLRFYHVREVVVHMQSAAEQPLVDEARSNVELSLVRCFNPPHGVTPWPYGICVLQLGPPANDRFNVIRAQGWSADEPWGTWIEGPQATARWVATDKATETLSLALVPICLPNRRQHVTLAVNSVAVADHRWENCDPWQTQVSLPAALVRVGWNSLTIQSDFADLPINPASGQIVDSRRVSVAATQLQIQSP